MTADQVFTWVAVVTALAAAVMAARRALPERRKLDTQATAIAVTAQQQIIDDQQGYIVDLQGQIVMMKREHHEEIAAVRQTFADERETTRNEVIELREENERLQNRLYALEARLA